MDLHKNMNQSAREWQGGVISILGAPSLGPIKLKEKGGVQCWESLLG